MSFSFYAWEQEGHTTIPNYFLKHLADFGLSAQETLLLILLMSPLTRKDKVDTTQVLSEMTNWSEIEIENTLNSLALKQYIHLDMVIHEDQNVNVRYSLSPLYEQIEMKMQLADMLAQKEDVPTPPVTQMSSSTSMTQRNEDIFQLFQQTFGRNLSALELEKINDWLTKDHYHSDLIRLALREAAVRQALTVNYVDKILLNWEKQQITTVEAAERALSAFESRHQSSQASINKIDTSLYKQQYHIPDWVE